MKLSAGFNITLGQIYIWLDVIFFALGGAMLLFWYVIHLTGNILTGRFKKRFILKQWPPHEGVVRPIERYMHLIHVIGMVLLAVSGFYIRFPDVVHVPGGRDLMKFIHYVCMFIITANLLYRYYYAFLGKYPDYLKFKLTWKEIKVMPVTFMYYFFIKDSKPHLAQYNPLQKMTYGYAFAGMMPIQALTGFVLFFRTFWAPYTGDILGGAANIVQIARIVHYSVNWFLIIFTLIHIYLACTENFPAFLLFFFGTEPEHHEAPGEHGEHVGHEAHAPAEHTAAVPHGPPMAAHGVAPPSVHAPSPAPVFHPEEAGAGQVGLDQSTATTILTLLNSLSRRISSLEQEIKSGGKTEPSPPPESNGTHGPTEPGGHDGVLS